MGRVRPGSCRQERAGGAVGGAARVVAAPPAGPEAPSAEREPPPRLRVSDVLVSPPRPPFPCPNRVVGRGCQLPRLPRVPGAGCRPPVASGRRHRRLAAGAGPSRMPDSWARPPAISLRSPLGAAPVTSDTTVQSQPHPRRGCTGRLPARTRCRLLRRLSPGPPFAKSVSEPGPWTPGPRPFPPAAAGGAGRWPGQRARSAGGSRLSLQKKEDRPLGPRPSM